MKKLTIIPLLLFILPQVFSIEITELMPNPLGDDASPAPGGEYIELYNKESYEIDLEGYYFLDALQNRLNISSLTTQNNTKIQSREYKIIYRNANTKFSLNNDKDEISLYDKGDNLLDFVSYNTTKENFSISKIDDTWVLSSPTPALANTKLQEQIITQETTCQYEVSISAPKDTFYENKINFSISIQKVSGIQSAILLKRIIKNSQDEIVKEYEDLYITPTTSKSLTYTPSLKDEGTHTIYAKITALNCTGTPSDETSKNINIVLQEEIKATNNTPQIKASKIEILSIEPKNLAPQDYITIKLSISKYNTQKNLVTVFLKDTKNKTVGEPIKINLYDKDYGITLELPYYIKEGCLVGSYIIYAQGLETSTTKQVYLNQEDTCTKDIKTQNQIKTTQKYESNKNTDTQQENILYQSINQKSKEYALILFIFVLMLIILKLLKEK